MISKILLVDDDENILSGFRRKLHDRFDIFTAGSGAAGIKMIQKNEIFPVIVSDYMMPEMNGVEFLEKVKELSPDSVRIMLTGQADMQAAIDVINKGNIFRFLTKPCSPELLCTTLEHGVSQYNLVTAEKELLGKTLIGAIKVMTDLLSLSKPLAFNRALRLRKIIKQISSQISVDNTWRIEIATMLSQIGCVTMPDKLLRRGFEDASMISSEKEIFRNHPKIARDMIKKIPRLEEVAEIIYYQEKNYNGSGFPNDYIEGEEIPLGARMLKVALDYDKYTFSGMPPVKVIYELKKGEGIYDQQIVAALARSLSDEANAGKKYKTELRSIDDLNDKMFFAEELVSESGIILGNAKQRLSRSMIVTLKNYLKNGDIKEPIKVLVIAELGE